MNIFPTDGEIDTRKAGYDYDTLLSNNATPSEHGSTDFTCYLWYKNGVGPELLLNYIDVMLGLVPRIDDISIPFVRITNSVPDGYSVWVGTKKGVLTPGTSHSLHIPTTEGPISHKFMIAPDVPEAVYINRTYIDLKSASDTPPSNTSMPSNGVLRWQTSIGAVKYLITTGTIGHPDSTIVIRAETKNTWFDLSILVGDWTATPLIWRVIAVNSLGGWSAWRIESVE